jgi:putative MATE family efflux protein
MNIEFRNAISGIERWYTLIILALRGQEHDYTSGSLRKAIALLAIPMVLEMSMESIFAVVDIFFVSALGANAVAVVGLTEAVITLIYAVAIGFSMAVTAVIARRVGEKNLEGAALTSGQVLLLGGIISTAVALVGLNYAGGILSLMGASDAVIATGKDYTSIMLGGCVTIIYLFVIAAIFRGAGDAIIAMRALWLANGINIILDPCFIYGLGPFPELGVTGAAVATNIGRGIGVIYLLYHLFGGSTRIRLQLKHLWFSAQESFGLLKVSVGGIAQFFIATASWVFLMRIVAQFGSDAVAGYTIAIRVVMFTFLPAWGLSNAAATLVGQCLGANNSVRAEQSVWLTAKYNIIFMLSVAFILFGFAPGIITQFNATDAVLMHGTYCLRILALGYGFFALGMVVTQAINGAGDTMTPTWINFFCFWCFQIPFAYVAANYFGWQTNGVAWSVTAAETLVALVAYLIFKRGKWRNTQV